MSRVLVTGGSGFVGRRLCAMLLEAGYEVALTSRDPGAHLPDVETRPIAPLDETTDWSRALDGVDRVVHLAARVHVMKETAADPLSEFRRANTAGTRRLALAAATAGVRRLVFLSTIKVNGESTSASRPFHESDPPQPLDPYGVSKWEAEQALAEVAARTGLETVILRPPLVYGPGVGGNFLRLLDLCRKGWPLPLGAVDNRRSLVHVANLASAIRVCLESPLAAGRVFLVRDGLDVSTAELIRRLSQALGRRTILPAVPPGLLRLAGTITGKSAAVSRLLDSLVVDDREIRQRLCWTPPVTLDQGLAETAAWFTGQAAT